jgi:hypothetical protein
MEQSFLNRIWTDTERRSIQKEIDGYSFLNEGHGLLVPLIIARALRRNGITKGYLTSTFLPPHPLQGKKKRATT